MVARTAKSVQTRKATLKKPTRVPIGQFRDIFEIHGLKEAYPDFKFRWVLDSSASGNRIVRLRMAGYELVTQDMLDEKGLLVGEDYVYKTEDLGSLVRVPNGRQGDYLYLMRLPLEFYEEDRVNKNDAIISLEREQRVAGADYGAVDISSGAE